MKTIRLLLIFNIILLGSCAPWKEHLVSKGSYEDAIQNAINDFLNTSSHRNNDSVFQILVKDFNNGILGVSILNPTQKQFVYLEGNYVNYNYLPTRYLEKQGKLFFWDDSTRTVTPDVINIFKKYNQIDTAIVNVYYPIHIDDSKKSVNYYFCSNNLLKYTKIHTKYALGYHMPKNLKCN